MRKQDHKRESGNGGVLLPPAIGYSSRVLLHLARTYPVAGKYLGRMAILGLINLINAPFRIYEKAIINPEFKSQTIDPPPIFILGHWRSGTTHLHNILCRDPAMGYLTTYQSVFPDTMIASAGKLLFENFTRWLIPRRRAGDNVRLNVNFPQEEEFALGATIPLSFYYFWMYPNNWQELYEKAIHFREVPESDIERWLRYYRIMIRKALRVNGGDVFLSKNPAHTGRVAFLAKAFPGARFIYLFRNPVSVYLSTVHFFEEMMPRLQLQRFGRDHIRKMAMELYLKLLTDYRQQKAKVTENNIVEVSFEELEKDPETQLHKIYATLQISGFDNAMIYFKKYLERQSGYRKNRFVVSRKEIEAITGELQPFMDYYGYGVPDTIHIED
ncbi:MAG: sulfotransferase [Bacteroidales bacterium]